MSRLEELIQTLCPHGVDNKNLDQVCSNISAGGTPSTNNSDYYDGNIPWLRSGEINFNHIDKTNFYITKKGLENSSAKWIKRHSVLIAMTGATVARSGVNDIPLTANQSVCALETNELLINYRYLFYCLSRDYEKIRNMGQGVLTSLNITNIKKIVIPVPPLSVQKEIVRILDTFTALEEELVKELEARTKQYEYYRDALLNFSPESLQSHSLRPTRLNHLIQTLCPNGVENVHLGKITKILRGKRLTKNMLSDDDIYPVFHGGLEPLGFFAESNRKANTVMVINVGASAGTVGYSSIDFWSSDGCYCIEKTDLYLDRFLYYILLCKQDILRSKVRFAGIPTLDSKIIEDIEIPLLPIPVQEEIVAILDRFEALVSDLKEGLPAEIALRRKQYEYYRGKLLSFC